MIHGYHLILAIHGFWLPNDPRGSWSEMVRKWELIRYGPATKSLVRRSLEELSAKEHLTRERVRKALKYPAVTLDSRQIELVAVGFADRVATSNYTAWACSILPEHAHLVIARHCFEVEKIANQLKGSATRRLIEEGLHPLAEFARPGKRPPRMWVEHEWKAYLDSESAIDAAIQYVQDNPVKERRPKQDWPFVEPFRGLDNGAWTTYH